MHKTPTWPSWPSLRAQATPRPCMAARTAPVPRKLRAPSSAPAARPARPVAHAPRPCACHLQRTPARPSTPARLPHALSPSAQRPSAHACAPQRSAPSLLLKWAVAHFRFCTFFFFHFFQPLENTKNIFIYFLSFSSTPINLLKFISSFFFIYRYIYFFHSPTTQINYLNLFYLFSCSSLHIVNSKVCFPTCLCAIYLSTQTFTSHIQHVIPTKHIHTTIHQST